MDARIVTTKKFLKEALLNLLLEQPLSKISVKTLCAHAEINRATFYSHYKDVPSLFDEIISEFISEIGKYVNLINDDLSVIDRKKSFVDLIKFVDRHSSLFVLIFENSSNIENYTEQYQNLRLKIKMKISDEYDKNIYANYITDYFFYAGGSLLYTWISNGKKETPEQLAKLMFALLTQGYSHFNKTK